ncbi:MAG: hypothetical protein GY940_02335 [bacterium]|nr:hypothetical protein [bacterium]
MMMKRLIISFSIITVVCLALAVLTPMNLSLNAAAPGEDKEKLPEVGSSYEWQKTHYIVRGVGNKPFEYVATGESLVLRILTIPGAMVFIPKAGEKVRVDPTIPMVWVGGKEKKEFKSSSYLKREGKNKTFMLLELDRSKR